MSLLILLSSRRDHSGLGDKQEHVSWTPAAQAHPRPTYVPPTPQPRKNISVPSPVFHRRRLYCLLFWLPPPATSTFLAYFVFHTAYCVTVMANITWHHSQHQMVAGRNCSQVVESIQLFSHSPVAFQCSMFDSVGGRGQRPRRNKCIRFEPRYWAPFLVQSSLDDPVLMHMAKHRLGLVWDIVRWNAKR